MKSHPVVSVFMTKFHHWFRISVCLVPALLSSCSPESEEITNNSSISTEADIRAGDANCVPEGAINYLCGLLNAEDLLSLSDTGMILASGMSGENITGHIYLINPEKSIYSELIFGQGFSSALDAQSYPDCPGPLNLENFSVHGLSLNEYEKHQFHLFITSHGEREAIEIFDLNMTTEKPSIIWKGCVPLPDNAFFNSVAILSDGGFVTTKMLDPSMEFSVILSGAISGQVFEWHPGGDVLALEGTELSGANGITLSRDERYMYVATTGRREIVKFDRSTSPASKESIVLDISPDNIRWTLDGKLLTVGPNFISAEECADESCEAGWSVLTIDPVSLKTNKIGGAGKNILLQEVSTALIMGEKIWLGTYAGDRVAFFSF